MALTLEEIESTIVQLQEDLRRAKKARTLLLKKGKQDARLAEDLDKLLNKDTLDIGESEVVVLDSFVSENNRPSLVSPLVETILLVNEEEDNQENESILLSLSSEEVERVASTVSPSSVGALTEEEAAASSSEDLASARPQGERVASTSEDLASARPQGERVASISPSGSTLAENASRAEENIDKFF